MGVVRSCGDAGGHLGRAQRGGDGRARAQPKHPLLGVRVPGAVDILVPRAHHAAVQQRAVRGARERAADPEAGDGDAGRVRVPGVQRGGQAGRVGGGGARVPAGRALGARAAGAARPRRRHHARAAHARALHAAAGDRYARLHW